VKGCDLWGMLDVACPTVWEDEKDKEEPEDVHVKVPAVPRLRYAQQEQRIEKEVEIEQTVPKLAVSQDALTQALHMSLAAIEEQIWANPRIDTSIPASVPLYTTPLYEQYVVQYAQNADEMNQKVLKTNLKHVGIIISKFIEQKTGFVIDKAQLVAEEMAKRNAYLGNSILAYIVGQEWKNYSRRGTGILGAIVVGVMAHMSISKDEAWAYSKEYMVREGKAGNVPGSSWYVPVEWQGTDYPGLLG
jgi:hypothetical protein